MIASSVCSGGWCARSLALCVRAPGRGGGAARAVPGVDLLQGFFYRKKLARPARTTYGPPTGRPAEPHIVVVIFHIFICLTGGRVALLGKAR